MATAARIETDFAAESDLTEFEIVDMGTHHQMGDLLLAVNLMGSLSQRPAIKIERDEKGRAYGIKLVRLVPKTPLSLAVEQCAKCGARAVRNGFCDGCATEIESDIALDNVERPQMGGRIHYGMYLPDAHGGSPE